MSKKLEDRLQKLAGLNSQELRSHWLELMGKPAPAKVQKDFLLRALAYQIQVRAYGGLSAPIQRQLKQIAAGIERGTLPGAGEVRIKPGTKLIRGWQDERHEVVVEERGFSYRGTRYGSLSEVACKITGTHWSGPAFFGLRKPSKQTQGKAQ